MTLDTIIQPLCPNPRCQSDSMVPTVIKAGKVLKSICWLCGSMVESPETEAETKDDNEEGKHPC
jgi:hypothetical protein